MIVGYISIFLNNWVTPQYCNWVATAYLLHIQDVADTNIGPEIDCIVAEFLLFFFSVQYRNIENVRFLPRPQIINHKWSYMSGLQKPQSVKLRKTYLNQKPVTRIQQWSKSLETHRNFIGKTKETDMFFVCFETLM
jgi:hypothetical protein